MKRNIKNEVITNKVNIMELSRSELISIGFQPTYRESEVLLVPFWAFDLIPDGAKLVSIFDQVKIKGIDYIDLDTRGGFIAFGIASKE